MSLRRRVLNRTLRLVAKPALNITESPGLARLSFAWAARAFFRTPAFTTALRRPGTPAITTVSCGKVQASRALLYFHGGGYLVGSAKTHMGLIAEIARRTQMPIYVPDYRLAPEYPAPSQFEDACAAWVDMLARGFRPEDIIIGGDSAGGGLALALLSDLCTKGTPPAAAIAFSPWTDLTGSGRSIHENAMSDPIFPAERFPKIAELVLGKTDPRDPRVSPLFADFPNCPPVFIQVSATEILRDDSRRMAPRLGAALTLDEWRDVPHVWPLFAGWLPEADQALDRVAAFMRAQVGLPKAGES